MDEADKFELYESLQEAIAEQTAALLKEIGSKKSPGIEARASVLQALALADLALHGIETAEP